MRSTIGAPEKHKKIVRGLGLRKLNQVVERADTPAVRGMVQKAPHLLAIVGQERGYRPRLGAARPGNGQDAY